MVREVLTVVTRKGQITVPIEIRRALGLKEGDKVAVSLADGDPPRANLRRVGLVAEMTFGSVTPRKRPEDFDELRRLFEEEFPREELRKPRKSDPTRGSSSCT